MTRIVGQGNTDESESSTLHGDLDSDAANEGSFGSEHLDMADEELSLDKEDDNGATPLDTFNLHLSDGEGDSSRYQPTSASSVVTAENQWSEAVSSNAEHYDEAPPEYTQDVLNTDTESSQGEYIYEDNDEIIITNAGIPFDEQGYFNRFVDEDAVRPSSDKILRESRSLWDRKTLLGKVLAVGSFEHAKTITDKENTKQIHDALNILDKNTKIPIGPILHKITIVFIHFFFIVNLITVIVDISLDPISLTYKVASLFMCVVEQMGLIIMHIYLFWKRLFDEEFAKRKQQYIENILHEVLLYPLIIVSVVGFTTEQLWDPGNDILKGIQLFLLLVDMLNLLWAQSIRLRIIYKFMLDIYDLINGKATTDTGYFRKFHSPGNLVMRAFMTTVGNMLLMFYIVFLLGAQEYTDNVGSGDGNLQYIMSWRSGLLTLCIILLPIYSIILFFLINYYWVLTIFMEINIHEVTNEFEASVLSLVQVATKKRLHRMKNVATAKKIFFGLTSWWMILLVLMWQALMLLPLVTLLYGDNVPVRGETFSATTSFITSASLCYVILIIVFNTHLLLLTLIINFGFLACIVCFVFYPIFVPILFRTELKIHPVT